MPEFVEEVVLVDDNNVAIGTWPKATVHHADTPLHRAFSVFLFNSAGEVLFQQRSHHKKTWPLVWSNSCCGHPALHEQTAAAIIRRAQFELGVSEIQNLTEILPQFRYSCIRDGIKENEICPVWVGCISSEPNPNPDEVENYTWKNWQELVTEIQNNPGTYSEWCELEVAALTQHFDTFGNPACPDTWTVGGLNSK